MNGDGAAGGEDRPRRVRALAAPSPGARRGRVRRDGVVTFEIGIGWNSPLPRRTDVTVLD
ncbi:hypothetical protein ATKI12_9092 [Kitasatospora sp. Ki12]